MFDVVVFKPQLVPGGLPKWRTVIYYQVHLLHEGENGAKSGGTEMIEGFLCDVSSDFQGAEMGAKAEHCWMALSPLLRNSPPPHTFPSSTSLATPSA